MEVIGVHNPRSTPQSRNRKRDNAQKIGATQNFLTQQPMWVAYLVATLLGSAALETVFNR